MFHPEYFSSKRNTFQFYGIRTIKLNIVFFLISDLLHPEDEGLGFYISLSPSHVIHLVLVQSFNKWDTFSHPVLFQWNCSFSFQVSLTSTVPKIPLQVSKCIHSHVCSILWSLTIYQHISIDPCNIHHVGRRNNTIYPLWEMKSIVIQKYFIVLSSNMAYAPGVYCEGHTYFSFCLLCLLFLVKLTIKMLPYVKRGM